MRQEKWKPYFHVVDDGVEPGGPSLTRQSEAAACDVNVIIKRFEQSGILPMTGVEGLYLDVSEVGDYRTALDRVRVADSFFKQLPAEVRARFDNDAALFLDFASNPENVEEMRKMGLAKPAPVAAAVAAAVEPPKAA